MPSCNISGSLCLYWALHPKGFTGNDFIRSTKSWFCLKTGHLLLLTNVTMLSIHYHYCVYLALLVKQVMINIVTKNEIKLHLWQLFSNELNFETYSKSFAIATLLNLYLEYSQNDLSCENHFTFIHNQISSTDYYRNDVYQDVLRRYNNCRKIKVDWLRRQIFISFFLRFGYMKTIHRKSFSVINQNEKRFYKFAFWSI